MAVESPHLDDPQYKLGLDCGLRDLNWLYMREFLLELQQEFENKRTALAWLAARWWTAYDMVRSYERAVILGGNPTNFEDTYYRACLAEIKGRGLHLLNLINQNPEVEFEKLVGFTTADIGAIINELEIEEGAVYRAMTLVRHEKLKALLSGTASEQSRRDFEAPLRLQGSTART